MPNKTNNIGQTANMMAELLEPGHWMSAKVNCAQPKTKTNQINIISIYSKTSSGNSPFRHVKHIIITLEESAEKI